MKQIVAYCYLVIFSGWIMAVTHVPENIAGIVLPVLDVLPMLLFLMTFRLRTSSRIEVDTVGFWGIVLSFFALAVLSTVVHGGSYARTLNHVGIMFRFTPLAAILARRGCSDKDISLFARHFKIISAILLLIGGAEVIGGQRAALFFAPVLKEGASIVKNLQDDAGDNGIFGIFPNTVDYAYFLIVSYLFFVNLNTRRFLPRFVMDAAYMILVFFSGSKAALLIFLIILFISIQGYKVLRLILGTSICCICGILIYLYWDLFYWTVFINSQHSRLGLLMLTLPDFLRECSLDTLIGMSPDVELVHAKINSFRETPSFVWDVEGMGAFEDEFYVALPVYYGVLGFLMLVFLYYKLYKTLMRQRFADHLMRYRQILRSLFVCLLIAPLFNQITITRPFSLFFWIIIGIVSARTEHKVTVRGGA